MIKLHKYVNKNREKTNICVVIFYLIEILISFTVDIHRILYNISEVLIFASGQLVTGGDIVISEYLRCSNVSFPYTP